MSDPANLPRSDAPAAPNTSSASAFPPSPLQMSFPGMPPGGIVALGLQQANHWQGPFPPPEAVERYEKVHPGTFDRLLRLAEEAQREQIRQIDRSTELQASESKLGKWLGVLVAVLALVLAFALAIYGHDWLAGLFASPTVLSVASALVGNFPRSKRSDASSAG